MRCRLHVPILRAESLAPSCSSLKSARVYQIGSHPSDSPDETALVSTTAYRSYKFLSTCCATTAGARRGLQQIITRLLALLSCSYLILRCKTADVYIVPDLGRGTESARRFSNRKAQKGTARRFLWCSTHRAPKRYARMTHEHSTPVRGGVQTFQLLHPIAALGLGGRTQRTAVHY